VGRLQRIASVATMTDSVIVRLEKAAIVRVIHQEPAFSEMFIAILWAGPSASKQTCRSAVQFERETSCPAAPAVGKLWQGRET